MVLLQSWSCLYSCSSSEHVVPLQSQRFSSQLLIRGPFKRRRKPRIVRSFHGSCEIAEIAHNKVLIAAAVSATIGQLSKPFTSSILYGKRYKFDIRAAFQSGGFPSTHSSAVVATATTLGLERGFSDAIFGLAVVYASLVMYDAQGVRREVGVHAKALNKIIVHKNSFSPNDNICSQPLNSYSDKESRFEPRVLNLEANTVQISNVEIVNKRVSKSENTKFLSEDERGESEELVKKLKESVGHSKTEVLAGALLGFFVSLAVTTII